MIRIQNGQDKLGLQALLDNYSGLRIRPQSGAELVVSGRLAFRAQCHGHEEISDSFLVQIDVSGGFPRELPRVRELGGRVPHGFHTNGDGTLCLGSPLRLHLLAGKRPTLLQFVERCVVPYLYGVCYREKHGTLPFGELAHGTKGVIDDYKAVFRVQEERACLEFMRLTALQRRKANRHACPCGSGRRLGRCHNRVVNALRQSCGRLAFRAEYQRLAR